MSDQEEDFDQEEYVQDDDDEYEWNDDCQDDDYEMEVDKPSGNCFTPSKCGLKYDGKLLDQIGVPSKNACYSVYRQLAEICMVDINENFYSAMLTVKVRDQFIISSIQFPTKEPFFPYAPPVFNLQSHFKAPNDHYNIIFNCHPSLLKSRWNICTSIDEIIRDMIEIAKQAVVDMVDDDPHSTTSQLIDLIRSNEIDISGLFPNNKLHNLPSFGVIRENATTIIKGKSSKGTGYSDGHSVTNWNFANHNLARLDNLRGLLKVFESLVMEVWVIDTIYYIMNDLISPIITLDEFFRNFEYYTIMISSIAALAAPSPHIEPSPGLMKLYETLQDPKIKSTLEENEVKLLAKLEIIYKRFAKPDAASSSSSSAAPILAADGKEVIDLTGCEEDTPNKKRTRSSAAASGASSSSSTLASAPAAASRGSGYSSSEKAPDPNPSPLSARLVQFGSGARERVVEVEEPFSQHLFLADMNKTAHLPAKWYRKLRIELSTMPESLPNNVIVFTGINVSQPCLMKVLMFPECEDTPYCGGCFEFDVFIPPEYPAVSPKVLLVTTGYGTVRFNPNLYNCGKVCLSLLGTWSGEPWNPEVSNLTQVFNSILFLIFIEKPYFNEPGFQGSENTPRGIEASDKYNEVIRVATLEFGYLDHLKAENKKRQMSKWVIPGVIETWLTKGRKTAEKWSTENQEKKIKSLIASIDEAVARNNV